jgi:hypothetical protein
VDANREKFPRGVHEAGAEPGLSTLLAGLAVCC